jgi:Trp operon repressor
LNGLLPNPSFIPWKAFLTILEFASLQKAHEALLHLIMDEKMQRLNHMTAAPQHCSIE